MKKKVIAIVVLAILLLGILAVPVAAEESYTVLKTDAEYGVKVYDDPIVYESRIVVDAPAGFTLGDLNTISWQEYLVEGYPPHIDVILEGDALVFEYAYNGHEADGQPTYGAMTGDWYATFSDDGSGPATIDDNARAWLNSGDPGGPGLIIGTLAEWKAGTVVGGEAISADTPVLRFELEVDNWIIFTEAWVKAFQINGTGVDLFTEILPDLIQISVSPSSVSFGQLRPGQASSPQTITITNSGSVQTIVTVSTASDFYNVNMTIDEGVAVADWFTSVAKDGGIGTADLVVTIPPDQLAGIQTGTLIFWAEKATP